MAEVLRTKEHGSNAYISRTNVAVLAATNPKPIPANYLAKKLEVTKQELYDIYNLETVYQAFGRCAIRNRDNEAGIQLVVLSYDTAWKLHEIFTGSIFMGQLGDLPCLIELQKADSKSNIGRRKKKNAERRNTPLQSALKKKNRIFKKLQQHEDEMSREQKVKLYKKLDEVNKTIEELKSVNNVRHNSLNI